MTSSSTYSLLIRSEEKERSLSETFVYLLLIGTAGFTMWSFAQQPFQMPVVSVSDNTSVLAHAKTVPQQRA